MENMRFKRSDLLDRIKVNRENHHRIFLDAIEGFREKVIEAFTERIERVKKGESVSLIVSMKEPKDHTEEYDTIIEMMELTGDDWIELDQESFARYVLDKWEWRKDFIATSNMYSKTKYE